MSLNVNPPNVKTKVNELSPELTSINSLNPWIAHDSSSRGTMFSSSHISQALVIKGATPRRCQTGTESEFGRFTFKHKVPKNANIIKVIPKFRQTIGVNSIEGNPTNLIIYEDVETKKVSVIELSDYSTSIDNKHQHFGFRYEKKPIVDKLVPGMYLPEGTVLADSPNVQGEGDDASYNYGIEVNTAFMGVPGVIEDGVIVSEDFVKRVSTFGYEKRVVNWGKKYYPLNLYGDKNNYKPFPDIGDRVRDDGLLFALRSYDELLAPIEMEPSALMEPDYIFDKLTYGIAGAKVIDINVHHDETARVPPTPFGMDGQARKYYDSIVRYHTTILEVYSDLHKERRESLEISHEFHRLLVESMSYVGFTDNPAYRFNNARASDIRGRKVKKLYRRNEIDDWRVEVVFEYEVKPTIGFKLTNLHGGKGVICDVWKTEKMPVDINGNRADIIMDGDSIIKRMNLGVLYEHWFNACSRDVTNRIREHINQGGSIEKAWDYLMSYYGVVNPKMRHLLEESGKYEGTKEAHVKSVISDGVYLWLPSNNEVDYVDAVSITHKYFPPTLAPVRYQDNNITEKEVLIGSVYYILLEKTGVNFAGTSSAKLQHFGLPARVSNSDKYASPGRNQPVRIMGEAENRLLNAVVGSDVTVDLLDQSNNPETHKAVVRKILTTEKPTHIDEIVDRRDHPLGNSRPHLFINHMLECGGVRFVREIDDPIRQHDVEKELELLKNKPRGA